MGLLQNIRVLNAQPIRHGAGGTAGSVPVATSMDRCFFNRPEQKWKMYIGEGSMDKSRGFPYGPTVPYQINLPLTEGGTPTTVAGAATLTGAGSLTISSPTFFSAFYSNITGSGTLDIDNLELTVALASDLVGSGDLTGAADLIVSIAASLTGAGVISEATLESIAQMASALTGSGVLSDAAMDCLAFLAADITASGEITATMMGKCAMAANITSAGEIVTAASCAQAVLDATVEGSMTLDEAIKILLAVAAGKTSITDLGNNQAEVYFRDINDTVNRVHASMDGSERKTVVLTTTD